MRTLSILCVGFLFAITATHAKQNDSSKETLDYWEIKDENRIVWDLTNEDRIPHKENIEMAGQNVAAIIYYEVDKNKNLSIKRDVIFPQLRTYNKHDEPDWKKYRAYFRRTISDDITPILAVGNKTVIPKKLDSIQIDGTLKFYHTSAEGLRIIRTLYPSMTDRLLVEEWEVTNTTDQEMTFRVSNCSYSQQEIGYKGSYAVQAYSDSKKEVMLTPGASYSFPFYFGATLNEESKTAFDYQKAKQERQQYLAEMKSKLVFKTPDPIINTLFYFSKIRAAESIFKSTNMGLIHSPGGGNYYLGTWANDQVEYSGPFFPYLGYENGNKAAYNTYKQFLKNIPEGDEHIPYAFEVDGNFPMTHLDRGDAAMIAYGTSHYLLASGNREQAAELWPLIEWSLEYCHKKKNKAGAVMSESDEMEGRIETGNANLSTSSLYYGGLKYSILLANEMGLKKKAKTYSTRKKEMETVLEDYFGASMEGLETYKYFAENKYLRHWIYLPLCMGITTRKDGTLDALFEKLWTENGILVELNNEKPQTIFWDRATLYALRGAMKVGATDRGYEKLRSYSRKRLLGDHVPYVIEAYPENNMKHLSAESALYCRIFTEGMLGLEPLGFNKIQLTPTLPDGWQNLSLQQIAMFGKDISIEFTRAGDKILTQVTSNGKVIYKKSIKPGQKISVDLG